MDKHKTIRDFVIKGDFSQDSIDNFVLTNNYDQNLLMEDAFDLLEYFLNNVTKENDYDEEITNIIDFLVTIDELEIIRSFILKGDFSQKNIDNFLSTYEHDQNELIEDAFNLLENYIDIADEEDNYEEEISRIIDFLIILCDNYEFDFEGIKENRIRIKKARINLNILAKKYYNDQLLMSANRLDEVVLDKNLGVNNLITIIKALIDRKESVNIIKVVMNFNKSSILFNNCELFDYVFNLAVDAIKSNSRDIFYYITLLKIFYTPRIDNKKYASVLFKNFNDSNSFANEIYMLICGIKESLSLDEIKDKYEISENYPYQTIYIPKEHDNKDFLFFTMDGNSTYIRDDGLAIKRDGENYIVKVIITDVASKIEPGSPADVFAYTNFQCKNLSKGLYTKIYHNDVLNNLSLYKGSNRSVITLNLVMNAHGEIKDYYFETEDVLINDNLTYSESDFLIDHNSNSPIGKSVRDFYTIASALSSKNSKKVKYQDLKNKSKDETRKTKSDIIINEFMLLYGTSMASVAKEEGFPFCYSIQYPQYISDLVKELGIEVSDYTKSLIEKIYMESQYSAVPRYHDGLNVQVYGKASSPLWKYVCTRNQQYFHHFHFKDLPIDVSEEKHIEDIAHFNQRTVELALMRSEYGRQIKLSRKK